MTASAALTSAMRTSVRDIENSFCGPDGCGRSLSAASALRRGCATPVYPPSMHAEIHALAQAGERARGATLVVTLEPCCHFGKTGPCTRALLAAGVGRVVVGMQDPAPHAAGGIAELRAAGLQVEVGLLEDECR